MSNPAPKPSGFQLFVPTEVEAPHVYPSQVLHPFLATVRTGLAVFAALVLSLGGIAAALAVFLPRALEAIVAALPPAWVAPVTSAMLTVVGVAMAITRLMAIPGVNDFLTKLSLGATPKVLD